MAYKKGLPRPTATKYSYCQITIFGEPIKTVLKIKKEHRLTDRQSKHKNKGEIINRMISDYVDFCADCNLKPLFELPYNVHECVGGHKVTLPSGTTMYVCENKPVSSLSLQIFLHGKALDLVEKAQKMMRENQQPAITQRIVNYFLERMQAFIDQREIDYINYYKQKYRL